MKDFVKDVLKDFGGLDLLSRTTVSCSNNEVVVEADEDVSHVVHGSLFFCGEYKSVKCKFEQL